MRTFPIFAFFLVAAILMFHFPTEFTANAAKVSATPIFVDSQSTSHDSAPRDLAFNTDGTKMFVVGRGSTDVGEYTCDVGFDVSSCNYDSVSKDVGTEDGKPTGLAFNTDGTKMFVTGNVGDDINEYICTAGFDVTSCDLDTVDDPLDVRPEGKAPMNLTFNTDGTKMFVAGAHRDNVNEYICTTGFDVSTCTFEDEFDIETGNNVTGLTFSTDGTKMFTTDRTHSDAPITEYTCDVGFDISSCNYVDDFSLITWDNRVTGIEFNTDGTKLFVLGDGGNDVNEFTLSCAFQIIGICGEEKGSNCPDCVPPSISKRGLAEIPDGFKINDEIISVKKYTNNPSQPYEVNVGDPVTFNLRAYENSGPMNIIFSAVYMDMHGKSISRYDSSAYVRYHMDDQSVEYIDKNDIFFAVGVTHEVTKPYPNINQEMMDITFTIIFAKPMETSHIVMELWDNKRNPEWVNILDAIKVSEIPVVEEPILQPEVPKEPEIQIEQEPIPESPLEPEPEPAPLPDEEIVLTETEPEKSILSFVDTSKEPNHYVKRYVTETEYKEWFDMNYPDYTIWEAVGITQHEYDAIAHKIESEPKLILISEPHYYMEAEKEPQTFELESTYESEPSPRKSVQEKNDFWSWFFSMFS